MRRIHGLTFGYGILLAIAVGLFCPMAAEDIPDSKIRRWIEDLASRKFSVRQLAYEELVKTGKAAFPLLEQAARDGTPEQRFRAREVIQTVYWRILYKGLREISEQDNDKLDLDKAMWLISLVVDPNVNRRPLTERLDTMAEDVRAELGNTETAKIAPQKVVESVIKVLRDKHKLAGAHTNYDHPRNSSLDRVLATGKGLPIVLSHIAVSVAERLDLPLVGVPVPGRYMFKYDGSQAPAGFPKEDIIVDPFGDWKVLRVEQIQQLIPGFNPDSHLAPSTRREIVNRMLRNLASDFAAVGQSDKAEMTLRLLQLF